MDNVISIFDRPKKDKAPPAPENNITEKVEQLRSRVEGLLELAEEIQADVSKLDTDEIVGVSKERVLGYFDSVLDQLDDLNILFLPEDDAA